MKTSTLIVAAILVSLSARNLLAQAGRATAPPSRAAATAPAIDQDVMGNIEPAGQALVGSRGRHYLFGGFAVADYSDSVGKRRIVALQRQDEINDERYVYYREVREGHRWAFALQPAADGRYGVYFQLASSDPATKPAWVSYHRAQLEESREGGPAAPVAQPFVGRSEFLSAPGAVCAP